MLDLKELLLTLLTDILCLGEKLTRKIPHKHYGRDI